MGCGECSPGRMDVRCQPRCLFWQHVGDARLQRYQASSRASPLIREFLPPPRTLNDQWSHRTVRERYPLVLGQHFLIMTCLRLLTAALLSNLAGAALAQATTAPQDPSTAPMNVAYTFELVTQHPDDARGKEVLRGLRVDSGFLVIAIGATAPPQRFIDEKGYAACEGGGLKAESVPVGTSLGLTPTAILSDGAKTTLHLASTLLVRMDKVTSGNCTGQNPVTESATIDRDLIVKFEGATSVPFTLGGSDFYLVLHARPS
jgi:hypothetical protein